MYTFFDTQRLKYLGISGKYESSNKTIKYFDLELDEFEVYPQTSNEVIITGHFLMRPVTYSIQINTSADTSYQKMFGNYLTIGVNIDNTVTLNSIILAPDKHNELIKSNPVILSLTKLEDNTIGMFDPELTFSDIDIIKTIDTYMIKIPNRIKDIKINIKLN